MPQNLTAGKRQPIVHFVEPAKRTFHGKVIAPVVLLFFFSLPAFALLHEKGILLWLVLLCCFLYIALHARIRYRYELTDTTILRYVFDANAISERIVLREIESMRQYDTYTRIRIPKKTYLIYTGSTQSNFIQELKRRYAQASSAKL